jgi:integrase
MCGIVGYVGPRAAPPLLLEGLKRLEYRGYDSAGLSITNGKIGQQSLGAFAARTLAEAGEDVVILEATPHLTRHSHRSWLGDIGVPSALADERMGHLDTPSPGT